MSIRQLTAILAANGFHKAWQTSAGGSVIRQYEKCLRGGRTLEVQLFGIGKGEKWHRVSHSWAGCTDTRPTEFDGPNSMQAAIEHESTRMDNKYAKTTKCVGCGSPHKVGGYAHPTKCFHCAPVVRIPRRCR